MDGFLLGYIVRELADKLIGARVDRVQQPEKDELHLLFRGQDGAHRLLLSAAPNSARAHLTAQAKQNPAEAPMFCMLMRKLLIGGRVADVRQMGGDRVLEMEFGCIDELGNPAKRILSCEIMGRHSNIILRNDDGRIADAIRHVGANVSRVREAKPGIPYLPPPPQGKLDPTTADITALAEALAGGAARLDKAIADTIAGLSISTARELSYRLTGEDSPHLSPEARAALAAPLRRLFDEAPAYGPPVLVQGEADEIIDVFAFAYRSVTAGRQREVPDGPSVAMDAMYSLRDRRERVAQKASALTRSLRTHIERCESRLALHEELLVNTAPIDEARICGELLTANLHLARKSDTRAKVPDYYTGGTRVIALDPRLTPAQNAQRYYKQYQKMRAAQVHAKTQAAEARAALDTLEGLRDDLRKCNDVAELDEIRQELVRLGYLRASHTRGKPRKPAPTLPMVFVSSDGLRIRVGRNSAQNDRLTASAPPRALWLHAKNMAGSHVIVDSDGEPPESTLREAAMLAAWFSRGYRSAKVPVDYTERAYVKKPSGAAPGFVTYTHQRTLYVTPDQHAVDALAQVDGDH